ncbi:hypothetical protein JCM8547_001881 [Rhodosporidiobolus lusitaniae]
MAVRRAVRRGLLLSEHPTPSTSALVPACASCRRALSSALHLPTRSAEPYHTQNLSNQAKSSWAALSKASQALLTPSEGEGEQGGVELSEAANELVQHLKRSDKDASRVWELFQQVDLEGHAPFLPLVSLHALLAAIHSKPRSSRLHPLSLRNSTNAARAYQTKANLIRTRLREAGGTTTQGDLNALLSQYHALRNAPGATRTWDELVDGGFSINIFEARRVLEAYLGWIEMHGRTSGRAVERTAAEPLVRKSIGVLADLKRAGRDVEPIVEPLLKIAVKAGDIGVFAQAVKDFYAFDLRLPGAAVETALENPCEVGEAEVYLMLEALAEKDDLSGMIALFETFDHPSPSSPSSPYFFTQSFSSLSLSDAPPTSTSTALPSDKPHPIGTRAFTTLIQTAARLENNHVARHYFDLLFRRWQLSAEERIGELEAVVGISAEAPEAAQAEAAREVKEETDKQDMAEQTTRSTSGAPLRHSSLMSRAMAFLVPPPASPAAPYTVPSTIIATLAHHASLSYDANTARYLRMRTRRYIQLTESHIERIAAVLERLQPTSPVDSADPDAPPSPPTPIPASLLALQREVTLSSFHLAQLRLTLDSVKHDSNIIAAHKHYRALQTELTQRTKKIAAPSTTKREQLALRPGVRRKEKQVLLSKMVLVRHRLNKMREIEGLGPGRQEWEKNLAELRVLKSKYEGAGWTELSSEGEVLGKAPHVEALQS